MNDYIFEVIDFLQQFFEVNILTYKGGTEKIPTSITAEWDEKSEKVFIWIAKFMTAHEIATTIEFSGGIPGDDQKRIIFTVKKPPIDETEKQFYWNQIMKRLLYIKNTHLDLELTKN